MRSPETRFAKAADGIHIAYQVLAEGPVDLVWVMGWTSQTVKDLVAGSGLAFEDAGEHELKGVPETWRLYRVIA